GLLSALVFISGIIFNIRKKRYSIPLLLLAWALLPLVFWSLRTADGSRHHIQSCIPVALGVGIALVHISWDGFWRWVSLIVFVLVNYFAVAPSSSTLQTSGILFQSSYLIKDRVGQYHVMAENYAQKDIQRKVILGSFTNPYVDSEV